MNEQRATGDTETSRTRLVGPVSRTDIVRYAGASGDFHPLHHDAGFARAAGFPDVFAMGMLQAGILSAFAADWLGAERIRSFSVRFREQVWPGDTLTCCGQISRREPGPDGEVLVVDLACTRQTGSVAVTGTATFLAEPPR
jgi:acyl dehydratase